MQITNLIQDLYPEDIKNAYNPTIKSESGIAGGLFGKAINTNIDSAFVSGGKIKGDRVGGLVGEYVVGATASNMTSFVPEVENKISNSFIDTKIKANNIGGLVHTITNNTLDNFLYITDSYYTSGNRAVSQYLETSLQTQRVIKPNSKRDFVGNGWKYNSKYENGELWCDYDYADGSQKLEFGYPIQSGFVKVYLTGSHYETVIVTGNGPEDVENVSTLSEAFTKINDSTQEATINLLVEKVFMEARAEAKLDSVITVNAAKDTTLVRGEHNTDSMFVATGTSKIVLGNSTETLSGEAETATITLDGNREKVEKENLESGALVVGYGGTVEINENVVLQNNVNTNTKYGGGLLLYACEETPKILGTIKNCSSEYDGGGICFVGSSVAEIGSIVGCSARNGGAAAIITEMDQTESVTAVSKLYGNNKKVIPTATVTSSSFSVSGYDITDNTSTTSGGALYFNITSNTSTNISVTGSANSGGFLGKFTGNSALNGGAIYIGSLASTGYSVLFNILELHLVGQYNSALKALGTHCSVKTKLLPKNIQEQARPDLMVEQYIIPQPQQSYTLVQDQLLNLATTMQAIL